LQNRKRKGKGIAFLEYGSSVFKKMGGGKNWDRRENCEIRRERRKKRERGSRKLKVNKTMGRVKLKA